VEFLRTEAARIRAQVDSAQLRSPISGVVVTPNLQNAAGEHLESGAAFAQVFDLSSAECRVAVSQEDIALIRRGQPVSVKLNTYPQRTWRDTVSHVSPEAEVSDGQRSFAVEVQLTNPGELLRAGMSGRAKISIGLRPAGYVLLRRPALWIWQTLWNWIGW
jgi:multidrug efflux pump subunit AcrA (membrane-fusion protein)